MATTQPRHESSSSSLHSDQVQHQTFSVSVGKDDWANQVIDNVVGNSDTDNSEATDNTDDKDEHQQGTSDPIQGKILEKKRLFHQNRFLELKNLPDCVTEQDIRSSLSDVDITSVTIDKTDGRVRPGAKLVLAKPELLDSWSQSNVFVKNKEVSVMVGPSDSWLCVARLPLSITEDQFQGLVSSYGRVGQCFLVVSEVTGQTKGYGVVRYQCSQAAAQARHLLDGRVINGYTIQADWLSSTHVTYSSLHSKCLYVDNLPPQYRDMATFRNIFSVVKNPPYCQIAMKNGVIQNWGLVEFFDSDSAELTQDKVQGYVLNGHKIRVSFCIPGVNAINIYMAVVNAKDEVKNKKALLDDAPSSSVYSQLQKLSSQNPAFAQNLENIIQTQIQSITSGTSPSPSHGAPPPPKPAQSNKDSNQRSSPTVEDQQLLNSNAQAALMILLTAQRQSAAGEMSLLSKPEVVQVLQSLVCSDNTQQPADTNNPYSELMRIPSLGVALGVAPDTTPAPSSKSPPPLIANNMNLLTNTQSLTQLLGVISSQPAAGETTAAAVTTTSQQIQQQLQPQPAVSAAPRPALMSVPPPATTQHLQQQIFQQQLQQQQQQQQQLLQQQQQQLLQAQLAAVGQLQAGHLQPVVSAAGGLYQPMLLPGLACTGPPPAAGFLLHPPVQYPGVQLQPPVQYSGAAVPTLPAPYLIPACPQANAVDIQPPALTSPPSHSPVPRITASSPATTIPSTPSPISLKRKATTIPPSPEASPQGPYIGQHSQGLGGHYADSYWAKKRFKQGF